MEANQLHPLNIGCLTGNEAASSIWSSFLFLATEYTDYPLIGKYSL
jgi:hypothetical protein